MKFHRHSLYFGRDGSEKPNADWKRESGYMYCDLCKCKPTSGTAGDPPSKEAPLVGEILPPTKPDDVES